MWPIFGKKAPTTPPSTTPRAFLRVRYFDAGGSFVGMEERQMTDLAYCQTMRLTSQVPTDGSATVSVEYEGSLLYRAYFDDLSIVLMTEPIAKAVQENHYDPFGLNLKGLETQGDFRWLYNAQNELETLHELDLYETPFRSYDAQLGRFHQADPLAPLYDGISPYQYAYNNPISFNDPMGLEAEASPSVVPSTTSGAAPVANEVKAEVKSDDLPDAPMLEPIKEMPTLASAGPNVEMTLEKQEVLTPKKEESNDSGSGVMVIGQFLRENTDGSRPSGQYYKADGTYQGSVKGNNMNQVHVLMADAFGDEHAVTLPITCFEFDQSAAYVHNEAGSHLGLMQRTASALNNDWQRRKEERFKANKSAPSYQVTLDTRRFVGSNSQTSDSHELRMSSRCTNPIKGDAIGNGVLTSWIRTRDYAAFFNTSRAARNGSIPMKNACAVVIEVFGLGTDYAKGATHWLAPGDISDYAVGVVQKVGGATVKITDMMNTEIFYHFVDIPGSTINFNYSYNIYGTKTVPVGY